jgi:hypothetical protein
MATAATKHLADVASDSRTEMSSSTTNTIGVEIDRSTWIAISTPGRVPVLDSFYIAEVRVR